MYRNHFVNIKFVKIYVVYSTGGDKNNFHKIQSFGFQTKNMNITFAMTK